VLKTVKKEEPEIVILDVMLPKSDGFEVLKQVRLQSDVPVIMLTARGEEADRVVGLELGADDYLPKPFSPRELLARMKAVLRRACSPRPQAMLRHPAHRGGGSRARSGRADPLYCRQGGPPLLRRIQVLKVLMENPNRVLSRDHIMNLARGRDFMAFDRSIDVHISKLRAKLESDPHSPKRIKTIWGSGYMFVSPK
jgi:two-component system, OmpR family, phosphate regulon response regulator OmpR